MKHVKFLRKIVSLSIISTMIFSYIPTEIWAQNAEPEVNVNMNVEANGGRTSVSTGDKDVDILVDVDLVQRTMNVLDIAKFVNTSNAHGIKQDYKSNLKESLIESLPEYSYADIVEYEGFNTNLREAVTVSPQAQSSYAAKLEWLIEQNMINRTTYYMFNNETTYSSMHRTPRPETEVAKIEEKSGNKNSETKSELEHKFYNPDYKISKTDFLAELMKADKVLESRPIVVQTPYTRMDTNMNMAQILTEPIEESPYTSGLGETGLDFATNEIVADHTVFKQAEILVTNDVTEMYLNAALNKNIVTEEEFGGDEGNAFLKEREHLSSTLRDGYLKYNSPIRQHYASTSFKLHKKIKEEDIVYPATLEDGTYGTVVKNIIDVATNSESDIAPPWGHTYAYNTEEFCVFANPANAEPIEIVKRPSVVEVNNNQYSYEPEVKNIAKDDGYEFFQKEEITVAEAYILTYKLFQAMGNESKLTTTEVDYLNSKYSLNFSTFTEEEREAAEYLIAKGIVDGNDNNLYLASSAALTNDVAIDLIYRTANKEARIAFEPMMTSIDKEMATKGYSQATISKTDKVQNDFEVVNDITKGKKVYRIDENGDKVEVEKSTKTYTEIQNADRVKNPSTYDVIYLRLPKYVSSGLTKDGYCTLITDDEYRIPFEPVNTLLNYGKAGVKEPTNLEEGESVYGEANGIEYVLVDKDGYYWVRYIVHKTLSSKVVLQAYTSSGTYTFEGIRGEGVYYIDEASQTTDFRKISLLDAINYSMSNRLHTLIIAHDLSVRNDTYIAETERNEIVAAGPGDEGVTYLWTQDAYGVPPTDNAQISSIQLPTLSDGSDLSTILFNGKEFISKDSNGDWVIDKDKINATTAVKESIIGLVKDSDNGKYYLQYQSPYQNYIEGAVIDVATKLSKIGATELNTDGKSSSPGYAKITSDGEMIALVAQEELEPTYGIKIMGETGRMLYNPQTGQRAFLNSVDNTTWIGNNITHYGDDDLIVTATGEGTEKKIYYNLAVILELYNNTRTALKHAGNEIFVAIEDPTVTKTEKYRAIDIVDVYRGTSTNKMKTDTTYVASVDDFKNVYMNMSAVGGAGSNFIYYKNKETDIKALLVYKPCVADNELKNYSETKGAYTSTASLTKSIGYNDGIESSANQVDGSVAKKILLESLMGVSEYTAAYDVMKGDYILNLYILSDSGSKDDLKKSFNTLIDVITNGDASKKNTLQNHTMYVEPTFGIDDFAKGKATTDDSVIKIKSLITQDNFSSHADFVTHKASGNLYALINSDSKPYYTQLLNVLGTRFYLKTSSDTATGKKKLDVLDYAQLQNITNSDKSADVIHMRYKRYYEETPFNYIPLEVYGTIAGRSGVGMSSNNGNYGANFDECVAYKLMSSSNPNLAQDANVFLTLATDKGGTDSALATLLELQPQAFTDKELKSYLSPTVIKSKDKFLNKLYDQICSDFDAVTGDYKIKNAVGNPETGLGSDTGWTYLTQKAATARGDMVDVYSKQKDQFFQGMWYGINSESKNKSYFTYSVNLDEGYKNRMNYVLIAGNSASNANITYDAHFYIGKIGSTGMISDLKPIQDYLDLPAPLRYYMDRLNGKYDLDAKNPSNHARIANDYGVTKQEVAQYFKPVRVYYRPTLAIPAGTTLVKMPINSAKPTELVLAPNSDIRSYFYPAKDVINSVLMMAQEQDDATFLYQLKKGSRVVFPTSNQSVVKLNDALSADNKGKLTWVKCSTMPSLNANGTAFSLTSAASITEAKLLQNFLINYYSVQIPEKGTTNAASVKLGDIMGPGMYRLPTTTEIKYVLSATEDKLPAVYELYKNTTALLGYNTSQCDYSNGVASYNPLPYHMEDGKLCVNDSSEPASLMLTLNLPPSLQVKEIPGLKDTWEVVSYWSIENFNVSEEDEIVAYVRERDTEILSVTEILKSLKAHNLDGTKYSKVAEDAENKQKWNLFTGFVTHGIPAIIIIIWLWLSVIYVVIFFGWSRERLQELNKQLGFDLIERLSFGVFSTTDEIPSLMTYFAVSLVLFLFLSILWGKYLLVWISYLINF